MRRVKRSYLFLVSQKSDPSNEVASKLWTIVQSGRISVISISNIFFTLIFNKPAVINKINDITKKICIISLIPMLKFPSLKIGLINEKYLRKPKEKLGLIFNKMNNNTNSEKITEPVIKKYLMQLIINRNTINTKFFSYFNFSFLQHLIVND